MIESQDIEPCIWAIWRDACELREVMDGGYSLGGDDEVRIKASIKKLKEVLKLNK